MSSSATTARLMRLGRCAFVPSVLLTCLFAGTNGCLGPDPIATLFLKGMVLDAQMNMPATGILVSGRTLSEGVETPGADFPSNIEVANNGMFELVFGILYRRPPYPRPDQVQVIVTRDGCEQQFLIDINQDTVVDISFPGDVIELRNPILIPPCESR